MQKLERKKNFASFDSSAGSDLLVGAYNSLLSCIGLSSSQIGCLKEKEDDDSMVMHFGARNKGTEYIEQ